MKKIGNYHDYQKRKHETEKPASFSLPVDKMVIPAYKLITKGMIIRESDEFLEDDCVTWSEFGQNYGAGKKYDGNLYVPVRRRV